MNRIEPNDFRREPQDADDAAIWQAFLALKRKAETTGDLQDALRARRMLDRFYARQLRVA